MIPRSAMFQNTYIEKSKQFTRTRGRKRLLGEAAFTESDRENKPCRMGEFRGGQASPPSLQEEGGPSDITLVPRHHSWAGETCVDLSKLIVPKKSTSDPINASKAQSQIQMVAIGDG